MNLNIILFEINQTFSMLKNLKIRNIFFYISLSVIFILFLFIYSVLLGKNFNSDSALHVLMIDRFEYGLDNYIWGETYLGSLFPAIGHFIKSITNIKSLYIAFFLQLIMLLTTWYISSLLFLKDNLSKILLAIALFLPPLVFDDLVMIGYSFLSSFSMFYLAILFLFKYVDNVLENTGADEYKYITWLSLYFMFMFLASWVLEFFLYYNIILSTFLVIFIVLHNIKQKTKLNLLILFIIIVSNFGFFKLRTILKENNRSQFFNEAFSKINNLDETINTFNIFYKIFLNNLSSYDVFTILFLLSMLSLAYMIFDLVDKNKNIFNLVGYRTMFLFATLLAYLSATFLSGWALLQGEYAIRYMSASYFFYIIIILNVYEHYLKNKKENDTNGLVVKAVLILYIVCGAYNAIEQISIKNIMDGPVSICSQLKSKKILGASIIGGYWEAYIFNGTVSDKLNIAVTTHDYFPIYRDDKSKLATIESKEVYYVQNRVFPEVMPDTIIDYGFTFIKQDNKPIIIEYIKPYKFYKYKNSSFSKEGITYNYDDKIIASWVGKKVIDNELNSESWQMDLKNLGTNIEFFHIFTNIYKGKYRFQLKISVENSKSIPEDFKLRFSNNANLEYIVNLPKENFKIDGYQEIAGEVEIPSDLNNGLIQLLVNKTNSNNLIKVKEMKLIKTNDKK